MEADGILLAVAESNIRHLGAARYDDEISIVTSLGEANRRFVSFDYELTCESRKVASGRTKHIFLNAEFRPTRLPDKYAPLFGLS